MRAKSEISYKSLNTYSRRLSSLFRSSARSFPRGKFSPCRVRIEREGSSSSLLLAKLNADKRRLTSSPRRFCIANQVAAAAAADRHCRGKSSRSIVSRTTIGNQVVACVLELLLLCHEIGVANLYHLRFVVYFSTPTSLIRK